MKTIKSLTIAVFIFITVLSNFAYSQEMLTQLIVKVNDNLPNINPVRGTDGIWRSNIPSIDALNVQFKANGLRKLYRGKHPSGKGLYIFSFPENSDMEKIANSFTKNSNVVSVEIDRLIPVGLPRNEPNDNLFTSNLGLEQIDAPEAWAIETGSADVIIQIIDTGVDFANPDLGPNMWQNLGEDLDGDGVVLIYDAANDVWIFDPDDINGEDDDGNGYDDDFVGWNFFNNNNDPTHTIANSSHGTKVASTAAMQGNNTIGGVGVSWNSSIMAAKAGIGGIMFASSAQEAILYAIDNGANILNMSWGGTTSVQGIEDKLLDAWNAGRIPVAAAMHTSPVGTELKWYPAAYDHVIGVTAVILNDTKKGDSQFGTWVDLSAPAFTCTAKFNLGGNPERWYSCGFGGTSTASPYVAGLAALIWSRHPSFTNEQIRDILFESSDDIDGANPGLEGKLGAGRINAFNALTHIAPAVPQNLSITSVLFPPANTTKRPKLTWTKNTEPELGGYKIYRKTDSEPTWLEIGDVSPGGRFPSYIDYDVVIFLGFGNDDEAYYKIKAYNTGNVFSNYSSVKSIEMAILIKPALESAASEMPEEYQLAHNRPNPFNPVTSIEFALPEAGLTKLIIYDLRGREVAKLIDGKMSAGFHDVTWDASRFASGVYIYRLTSGSFVATKKMVLLK